MRVRICAISVLFGLALTASADPATVPEFIELARDADIVVLGEIHDNPAHHRNQAEIVAALQPAALVFEMIPQADEDEVNELRAKAPAAARSPRRWTGTKSGWPDFSFYAAILSAAPRGAGVRRAASRAPTCAARWSRAPPVPFGPDAAIYGLDEPLRSRRAGQRARRCRPRRIATRCRRSCCPAWSRRNGFATPAWRTRRSGRAR